MSGRSWTIDVCKTCGRLAQWPFCEHRDGGLLTEPNGRWYETINVREGNIAARAELARAQATIAAVRALCEEADRDAVPGFGAWVHAVTLRRALDGTAEATP